MTPTSPTVTFGTYRRVVAFPAPTGVDANADVHAAEGVPLDDVIDGDPESELRAGPDVDDEDVLTDEVVEGRLQCGSLSVLLQLAGLPECEAAYARAARAQNTLRGYCSDWADFTT